MPLYAAEKLVYAFITSWLDSCNYFLAGCSDRSLKTLQLIHNHAAHVLINTLKRDHLSPVLASLHWLPTVCRIESIIRLLKYKPLHGLAPSYISGQT